METCEMWDLVCQQISSMMKLHSVAVWSIIWLCLRWVISSLISPSSPNCLQSPHLKLSKQICLSGQGASRSWSLSDNCTNNSPERGPQWKLLQIQMWFQNQFATFSPILSMKGYLCQVSPLNSNAEIWILQGSIIESKFRLLQIELKESRGSMH